MKLLLCTLLVGVVAVSAYTGQVDKGKIKFKISGRGLPDEDDGLGTTDGYVEVFLSENFGKETKLGKTNTVSNSENPDWSTILEFNFDRSKNQQLHFKVWDEDDLRTDDKVGVGWINAVDFVDRGQVVNVPLYKQGYLQLQGLDTRAASAPRVWPDTQKIKFKLSAENLPGKDNLGGIDPYAEIFSVDGITGKETKVGRTSTLTSNKNPQWGDTFDFNYVANKNQRFVVRVWDNDNLQTDDKAGVGFVDLEDYMRRGQIITVGLSKQGKLTVQRADGLPAVPPTAGGPKVGTGATARPTGPTTRPPFRSGSGK